MGLENLYVVFLDYFFIEKYIFLFFFKSNIGILFFYGFFNMVGRM